ncbi:hypothetical protein BRYFOR_07844 [Marvinbryantia formatexigens DSM 14469]|uniref:Uncharacterized protein n=1 Tax=Marvinbryantia formatexigens DSM 14469 TaxID=478749 RepID=C6LGT4_9FIRM|nr:hypothetical protein BRYFOR_07844 [Marvinbryantia formatexigens DSM 14469]
MRHIIKVVNPLGVKDTVTTKYMRQNEIFADAFNYFVYGGEQVINPESLEELDTREIDVPYGGEKGARQPVQKTRDVIKSVIAMMDKRTAYLLLAIENQSNIHYAMPVKNMVYDALQYAKQVEEAITSHKMSGDYKGSDSDEYLSGFMKADHLLPVVTLVIYFDSKEWDGPLSIHEMFAGQDARVLALVPDYKINLLSPASIEDEDFGKFQSSLKEVLSFIKYAGDKDELKKVLDADESFRHLGREEVDVLNACVGAKIAVKEGEEAIDVCLAIQQMNEEAAQKERISTLFVSIKNLMEKMGWSAEQSMDVLSVSDSDRKALWKLLK